MVDVYVISGTYKVDILSTMGAARVRSLKVRRGDVSNAREVSAERARRAVRQFEERGTRRALWNSARLLRLPLCPGAKLSRLADGARARRTEKWAAR